MIPLFPSPYASLSRALPGRCDRRGWWLYLGYNVLKRVHDTRNVLVWDVHGFSLRETQGMASGRCVRCFDVSRDDCGNPRVEARDWREV